MSCCWRVSSGCLVLFLASLLQCLRLVAMQTDTNTTSPLPQFLCTANTCRNGHCITIQQNAHCACDIMYRGEHCEHVNLDEVDIIIIASTVIFQWRSPPRLKGYAIVYYEEDSPEKSLFIHNIYMHENDKTLFVGNLEGIRTLYQVCIEDEALAQQALSTRSLEYITNCVQLQTQLDYNTLFGWGFAGTLLIVIILLMYLQRGKML